MEKIYFLNTKKVVITGAPGTGKTSLINRLEDKGFYCFHEIIRDMTSKARNNIKSDVVGSNPLVFVKDARQFNKDLLYARTQHFKKSLDLDIAISFFDRGIPDVLAYMDFFGQDYNEDFIAACENNRYDEIYIVPPWKEIYVSDNERLESFDEAEEIHEVLMGTYTRFGYKPITVPKNTVEERISFVLSTLNPI
ncbi:hypothetical protein HME9304_02915 [Flagellimonas maritima]|uniref:NadR/Ttd14 AAA domain-containing protein n=1 Tax=Flagellimonas maritima TaxID=1383885 RepID=A0A2Z4LWJ6_9FLAO|nr:hypothetical protein HME9304_02915 [Allomuricauda aurantiaca]